MDLARGKQTGFDLLLAIFRFWQMSFLTLLLMLPVIQLKQLMQSRNTVQLMQLSQHSLEFRVNTCAFS